MNYPMISLLEKNKKMTNRFKIVLVLTFLIPSIFAFSIDLPQRPNPPRLVNDYAGFLNRNEAEQLEQKLVNFDRETSTQIAIVILNDLGGDDIADYAVQLGRKWGIGQKGKNNGILMLIKPKTATSRGQVFIAPGYGLEGVVPDAICKRIVDREIIPSFKTGNYYEGINKGITTLMALTKGEFTADEYAKRTSKSNSGIVGYIVLLFIIILFSIIGRARRARQYSIGHNMPFWLALMMMSGTRSTHSGSFGNFSSGGGSFGGFGGFGGGSFGGGGAGGSW